MNLAIADEKFSIPKVENDMKYIDAQFFPSQVI